METLRVYEAALRIIVDALGMKRAEVLSSADLEPLAAAQTRIHAFDIDAMYERHIKGIYSAIVAFISETTFSRRDEQAADLQWLREASTQLVEAVKDTTQLQENLVRYVGDENEQIRRLYNRLRVQIALAIRELEEMRESGGGVMDVLTLDALKLLVDEEKNAVNEATAELVARRVITPSVGSSLINDSVYAYDIASNLLRAAQLLFVARQRDLTQAAHDVMLDKSELDQIAVRADTEAANQ